MTQPFDIQAINFLSSMYMYQEGLDEKMPACLNPNYGGSGGDQNKLPYAEMYHEMIVHAQFLKSLTNSINNSLSETESMYLKILLYGVLFKFNDQSFRRYMENIEATVGSKVSKLIVNFLKKVDVIYIIKKNALDLYDTNVLTDDILSPFIDNHSSILNIIEQLHLVKSPEKIKKSHLVLKKNNRLRLNDVLETNIEEAREGNIESAVEFYENEIEPQDTSQSIKVNIMEKSGTRSMLSLKPMFEISVKKEKNEIVNIPKTPRTPVKKLPNVVKPTVSSLLRFRSNITKWQEDEINWIDSLCKGNFDSAAIHLYAKDKKSKVECEEMVKIERKHLDGLLTHEEMIIARENVLKKNKEKYERFLEEKKIWEHKIEEWKLKEYQRILLSVDHVHNIKDCANKAKKSAAESKKSFVADLKQQKEALKSKIIEEKQKELEKKCAIIKEIKALHIVVKTLNKDKIFDFTETSNIGLFCEMSLSELKERLGILKIQMKHELEMRRNYILQQKQQSRVKEETTRAIVEEFMRERKNMSVLNKVCCEKNKPQNVAHLDAAIIALKNKLEEKKALRRAMVESR